MTNTADSVTTTPRSVEPTILDRGADGEWTLVGRRCRTCGETLFGRRDPACERCSGTDLLDIDLPRLGRLWGFTVLRNPPPGQRRSSRPGLPVGFGLVELGGEQLCVAALLDVPIDLLRVDLPLALSTFELYHADDGHPVVGFNFVRVAV